eukprot:TRINITY_DN2088_c0_g1_i1.p2 TRINITY_DN2088_c0_g1~~TRINITY_DN2088_c0_g1_i1.p2  ORF type:complete len:169 (-),score=55.97 TRINITY_DN2088_c0_g1_i1:474-980(-)
MEEGMEMFVWAFEDLFVKFDGPLKFRNFIGVPIHGDFDVESEAYVNEEIPSVWQKEETVIPDSDDPFLSVIVDQNKHYKKNHLFVHLRSRKQIGDQGDKCSKCGLYFTTLSKVLSCARCSTSLPHTPTSPPQSASAVPTASTPLPSPPGASSPSTPPLLPPASATSAT